MLSAHSLRYDSKIEEMLGSRKMYAWTGIEDAQNLVHPLIPLCLSHPYSRPFFDP